MADNHDHVGDFAEGQTETHTKPGTLMGDYAAGQEKEPRLGTVQPKGDFGEGQEATQVDPAAPRGDFARGQESPHK